MSRKLSFKGKLDMGLQQELNLRTLNGKRGYKITKFEVFPTNPGAGTAELVLQAFTSDQTGNITASVDFSDGDLLAVAFCNNASDKFSLSNLFTIFDNEVFNQNIFVNITDGSGGTTPANYYIELETMTLSDSQATQLTLKNLRTVASR